MTRLARRPTCNQCHEPIDPDTIEQWQRRRSGQTPTICARCLGVILDLLSIEVDGEPRFPENWQTIKTGGRR